MVLAVSWHPSPPFTLSFLKSLPIVYQPFRFEEMWLSDNGCGEVVEAAWRSCVSLDPNKEILGKIEKCGKDLTWWNYNVFRNVRREIKKKRDMLVEEEAVALRTGSHVRIRELQREINELMDRETRIWNQRSRILWLKNGDGIQNISIVEPPTGIAKM